MNKKEKYHDYLQSIMKFTEFEEYKEAYDVLKKVMELDNFNYEKENQEMSFLYWKDSIRGVYKKFHHTEDFLKSTIFICLRDEELFEGYELLKVEYCLCFLRELQKKNDE